jgi:hypothetical protein
MEIESIKTWQWMLAGLFVGFLFSCIVAWSGPPFDSQARDTMEQGEFENGILALAEDPATKQPFGRIAGLDLRLLQEYHKGEPMFRNVTVHPPIAGDAHYWITGQKYWIGVRPVDTSKADSPREVASDWQNFRYAAAAPYKPGYAVLADHHGRVPPGRAAELAELKKELGGTDSFSTVKDYLKAVSKLPGSGITYQFAWWELPPAKWSLPPLAGFLMIGIAWPLGLGVLQSLGVAKPAPVKKALAAPAPPKPVAVKNVKPVIPIAVAPAAPKTPLPEDDRQYRGEFYPVAKSTHKE